MRNFILFIRRFFNLILFLIIEAICVFIIARTNTLQGNEVLSSANTAVGIVYQKREDVVYYFGLKRMNDSLITENARLRLQLAEYKSVDTLPDTVVTRRITDPDSTHLIRFASYVYRTARVINNSVTAENNYITLNRGASHGITRNMAVLSGTGVVGRVIHVSDNFSSVLSILSVKQKVSGKLKDGTMGSVTWQEGVPNILLMEDIPQQIKVNIGDSVFTTSYSFFPTDLLIGTVVRKKVEAKNNLQVLYIKSATNFRNLQYVYVVEDRFMNERRRLEDSTRNAQ